MENPSPLYDCVIVGGGPGGLSAAIYLARFRRSVRLVDDGNSRAAQIPLSRNYPGFPDGIAGTELLQRLRAQAARFGVRPTAGTVTRLEKLESGEFLTHFDGAALRSKTLMLATGLADVEPDMPEIRQAIRLGRIRYCPICDGYEAAGKKVAVIGHGSHCVREAAFIRHFTDDLTILTLGRPLDLSPAQRALLDERGIRVVDEPVAEIALDGDQIEALRMRSGISHRFDTIYSMLGTRVRSELAKALGARCDADDNLEVDAHLQTTIAGLYAVGDVASGLNQISVATGHAAIAATAIHNRL